MELAVPLEKTATRHTRGIEESEIRSPNRRLHENDLNALLFPGEASRLSQCGKSSSVDST